MIGQTISHYKITEKLGEGGMGVVYKAEDTKLERTVALKFLAAHLLSDSEAKQRFLREAQAAAALNHPNICTVHEIDDAEGKTFLAMAFIEGESLEARVERGPLPLKEALDIGRQIAEGLEAAHDKGIVHRDIKPANVMVDAKGRATIMDFGLTRLTEASRLTKPDQAMGTVAYMSPEQAQGMEVDHRSDIWSLGIVLYEMVCGQRPFKGQYDQALFYEIVNQHPDPLTGLRAGVPLELEFIVAKCLAKNRDDRPSAAQEVARELRTLGEKLRSGHSAILKTSTGAPYATPQQADAAAVPHWKRHMPWALSAVSAVAALAFAFLYFRQTSPPVPEAPVRRFALAARGPVGAGNAGGDISISPDGRHIAYATTDGALWVHSLDQIEPRRIDGVSQAHCPFWSPDSEFIGFQDGPNLRKVSLRQGIPIVVCSTGSPRINGAAWSPDSATIVFTQREGVYSVPSQGGTPQKVFDHPHTESPSFLPMPDGRAALLFATLDPGTAGEEHQIRVLVLGTNQAQVVASSPSAFPRPFYSPSGHIVYVSTSSGSPYIWAQRFSLASLTVVGEAFPIAGPGFAPTVSTDGTLVYLPGTGGGEHELVWLDRRGGKTEQTGLVGFIRNPSLSNDGRFVAYEDTPASSAGTDSPDIWIYDLVRKTRTRLTSDPRSDRFPVWSPNAEQVAFTAFRDGSIDLFIQRADGGGPQTPVLPGENGRHFLSDWSHDGRFLLYTSTAADLSGDIGYLEKKPDGDGWEPHSFLQTEFSERSPKLSPDGRYVAYMSNESGSLEVHVQPFPQGGRRVTVSSNGGKWIRWRRDGRELFYVQQAAMIAVSVSTAAEFEIGQPERLFEHAALLDQSSGPNVYDVSADGQRFLLTVPAGGADAAETPPPSIGVVENWFAEFKDRQQN